MINSRAVSDLTPEAQVLAKKFVEACKAKGIDLLITSTYRDNESQAALYAQGRTAPGKIVTNAKPGQSFHNHRIAIDVVPLVNGKPQWTGPIWQTIGAIGKSVGFEWAGEWKSFKEMAHFQLQGYEIKNSMLVKKS